MNRRRLEGSWRAVEDGFSTREGAERQPRRGADFVEHTTSWVEESAGLTLIYWRRVSLAGSLLWTRDRRCSAVARMLGLCSALTQAALKAESRQTKYTLAGDPVLNCEMVSQKWLN